MKVAFFLVVSLSLAIHGSGYLRGSVDDMSIARGVGVQLPAVPSQETKASPLQRGGDRDLTGALGYNPSSVQATMPQKNPQQGPSIATPSLQTLQGKGNGSTCERVL